LVRATTRVVLWKRVASDAASPHPQSAKSERLARADCTAREDSARATAPWPGGTPLLPVGWQRELPCRDPRALLSFDDERYRQVVSSLGMRGVRG
jgi:hypothetical protein